MGLVGETLDRTCTVMGGAVRIQFRCSWNCCGKSPLSSEEPESILRLVSKLDMIFEVGLPDDKTFVMRILPLVPERCEVLRGMFKRW